MAPLREDQLTYIKCTCKIAYKRLLIYINLILLLPNRQYPWANINRSGNLNVLSKIQWKPSNNRKVCNRSKHKSSSYGIYPYLAGHRSMYNKMIYEYTM